MKKIMTLFLFFSYLSTYSQIYDNFSDGLFYETGRSVIWEGDVYEFIVNEFDELQLLSTVEYSPVQLRTKSLLNKNTSWYCKLSMDFTPSSSNYARIYLVSDNEDLCGEINGLFIRIGYTEKNICVMQSQADKKNKTLIKGTPKRLDKDALYLEVKVTLDITGELILYSRLYGESDFTIEGSYQTNEFPTGEWFGIVCNFTKTRSEHFFFEEFIVEKLDKTIDESSFPEVISQNENKFTIEYPHAENETYRIKYQLNEAGYHCKMFLYDISGRLVDQVLNNQILENNGSVLLENYKRFNAGIYILYIEIFDVTGKVEVFKLPLIV